MGLLVIVAIIAVVVIINRIKGNDQVVPVTDISGEPNFGGENADVLPQ